MGLWICWGKKKKNATKWMCCSGGFHGYLERGVSISSLITISCTNDICCQGAKSGISC